jgi:hypothetical protein
LFVILSRVVNAFDFFFNDNMVSLCAFLLSQNLMR